MVGKTLHFGQGLTNSKNKKKTNGKRRKYEEEDEEVIGITLPQINSS